VLALGFKKLKTFFSPKN